MKSSKDTSKRLPLGKALIWILSSSLLISGSSFLAFLYFRHLKEGRRHDPKYQIVAIVQTSKDKENLKTAYLAELLELSIENPRNLYAFDIKQGHEKLISSPVIKEAEISKIRPGTIWIDYALRKPVAFLGDYTNTVIDAEGVAFPFNPFFTPKTLPEIYLGIVDERPGDLRRKNQYPWGSSLRGRRLSIALSVLQLSNQLFPHLSTSIASIDVSRAFCSSCGQRQIVIVMHDYVEELAEGGSRLCIFPLVVRLGTDNYRQQLVNFVTLHSYLRQRELGVSYIPKNTGGIQKEAMVIDLRLSDLAYISTDQ